MDLVAIGKINSSYTSRSEAPRQGRFSNDLQEIEIFPDYIDGLMGIEDISHIIVFYWFHESARNKLISKPPKSSAERGVFTSRSPHRPNPIAFSIAEIVSVNGNKLKVKGLEAIDGSPILDLKMYSPELDCIEDARVGWLTAENQPRH